jgi:putative membrane protein
MRYQALMTAFTLSLGIWACRERDEADIDTTTVAFDTGMAAASATPATPKKGPSDTPAAAPATPDGEVLGSFIAANQHEVEHSRLGSTQGSTQTIRDLAKGFARDHDDLVQRARELGTKQSITATPPKGDPLGLSHGHTVTELKAKSGADFDRAYLHHEIEYHQALIKAINTDWLPKASNQELKTFLQQALPAWQSHLKGAQDLSANLPKS